MNREQRKEMLSKLGEAETGQSNFAVLEAYETRFGKEDCLAWYTRKTSEVELRHMGRARSRSFYLFGPEVKP